MCLIIINKSIDIYSTLFIISALLKLFNSMKNIGNYNEKVLPLLALGAVVASASVQAKGNWYVGADVLNSDLKVEGHSYSSSATGLGIAVGKELQFSKTSNWL